MAGGAGAQTSAAAYLAGFDRLVVVAPHPDDDVLGCGGALAAAAATGVNVIVIYVTDGAASHAGSAAFPPERLRAVREREACAGLAALGLTSRPTFLRIADGTVAQLSAAAADGVVDAIADACGGVERPLVMGPWLRDHHTDHCAVAALVRRACARCAGATLLEYAIWLDERGTAADRPHAGEGNVVALDVSAYVARKSAALAEHRSQLGSLISDATVAFTLPPALIAAASRPVETFLCVREPLRGEPLRG